MATAIRPADQSVTGDNPLDTAAQVAETVAGRYADEVDRDARFPHEAVDALRQARLLGALVPAAYGGPGCSLSDVATMTQLLGQHCASTAMVFAMHHIEVACIERHANGSPFFADYLREVAEGQVLIASATSEAGVGGDLRTSVCAIEAQGDRFVLAKDASVISYGAYADDVLVTARRAPDAASSDQVLALVRRSQTTLAPSGDWDTLGFRGTCSLGFKLRAEAPVAQVLPVPFGEIAGRTMLPVSHILWTSVWLGIATSAVRRARTVVRAEARKKPGSTPPSALRLAELMTELQTMRATVEGATREYESLRDDADALSGMGFAIRMNNLKLAASQAVVAIVGKALGICGMAGYKNNTPLSLGRHLRDAYGAALMINNDRIYGANAALLLVHKDD